MPKNDNRESVFPIIEGISTNDPKKIVNQFSRVLTRKLTDIRNRE